MSPGRLDLATTWPRDRGRICQAPALRPGVSSSSPIWPPLKLPGAKVHCMSGVADSSSTLAEAATIDGLLVSMPLPMNQPAHDLAGKRQAARALVGGLGADDRVGDACDVVVLHVFSHAALF